MMRKITNNKSVEIKQLNYLIRDLLATMSDMGIKLVY